jgi:hypothetical protein
MENKIQEVKERLIEMLVSYYDSLGEDMHEYQSNIDYLRGFEECAKMLLGDAVVKKCNDIAFKQHMASEGYMEEEVNQMMKETLETLRAGAEFMRNNPNVTLADLMKGEVKND